MKSITKILIALSLFAVMSCTAFALPSAVTVFDTADETVYNSERTEQIQLMGEGTEESPYEITCTDEFNSYALMIKSNNAEYGSKYYKLMQNIDFADAALIPFGTSLYPFTGTFDGNGYSLYNVSVHNSEGSGVIGYMTAGTVKNLSVSYKDMTSRGNYSTLKFFGGIVGIIIPASGKTVIIEGCSTDGDIFLKDSNTVYAGGVIGQVKAENGNLSVSNCVSYMSFDLNTVSDSYAAGFVAYAKAGSSKNYTFKNCVSFGDVKLISNNINANAAGFAAYVNKDEAGWSGWASDEEAELAATTYHFENCAALGNVYSESPSNVYVGGFIGKVDGAGTVNKSSIYRNASQTVSGSVGKVTVNTLATAMALDTLRTQSFYANTMGFDFVNIWYMSNSENVPCLRTVAKSHGAAITGSGKELRLNSKPGLRFRSEIEMFKRDYGFEYGVLVARKDELQEKGLKDDDLTFDYTGKKVVGVAYDSTTDKFFEKDDDNVIFTAVVHSIAPEHYDIEIVARTYIKFICDGETVVAYGNTQSSSINLSAKALKDSTAYDSLTDSQKEILETMLPEA